MANQCEIWSAIWNIDWSFRVHKNNNTTLQYVQNELLKIGQHRWLNGFMFGWPILCFGRKMAEGRLLLCTLISVVPIAIF